MGKDSSLDWSARGLRARILAFDIEPRESKIAQVYEGAGGAAWRSTIGTDLVAKRRALQLLREVDAGRDHTRLRWILDMGKR
jgi:hypothetical protein